MNEACVLIFDTTLRDGEQSLDASMMLEENGKSVTGRGTDTDTLVASAVVSARASVSASNRLIVKCQHTGTGGVFGGKLI